MDNHTFTPSRPGGVVCVAERIVAAAIGENAPEPCGYPAGHPIHDVTAVPADESAPLTAQQCADALRSWVRQMPGGGSQYLEQLLMLADERADALVLLDRLRVGLETAYLANGVRAALLNLLDRAANALRGVR